MCSPIVLQVSLQQFAGVVQGVAAGIGIYNFLRAFFHSKLTMSKHSSTYLSVGFTVNPMRSPIVYTSVLESQLSYSCHCDGAHESDVPVHGSDTFSPRYHRHVDVVLEYL